jgi:acetolactate synthase-1/2/3 large subunit
LADNERALIRIKQENKGNPFYGTPVHTARGAGALRKRLQAAFAADGPVIVEAVIDSREYDDVVLKNDRP